MTAGPVLDMLGDLTAALAEAQAHGYSLDAAWWAAVDRLADADEDRVRAVAAMAVALMATQLRPASGTEPDVWAQGFAFSVAMMGAR